MVSTHEIFRKPYSIELEFETIETPAHYRRYFCGRDLGKRIRTWRVQKTGYQDDKSMLPGVVSTGAGFTDSPDAEFIAGGINSKGPDSVALGRHGPFFHWGFSAAPTRMTESGRRAFVNSIHYISRFDRRPLLVRRKSRARVGQIDTALRTARLRESYRSNLEFYANQNRERAKARGIKAAGTRPLTAQEKWYLRIPERTAGTWEDFRRKFYERLFPRDVIEKLGTDEPAKYLAYVKSNLEYLHPVTALHYAVDADAKALGISNRDVAILDKAIELTASMSTEAAARGHRLLRRYTDQKFASPAAWRAWLDAERSGLFFSDTGGFRFFSRRPPSVSPSPASPSPAAARRTVLAKKVDEPTPDAPVVIDFVVLAQRAAPGSTVTVGVRMRVAAGWHTYAAVPASSPYPTTILKLELPTGVTAVGNWDKPVSRPSTDSPDLMVYEGDVVFLRRVRIGAGAKGKVQIAVRIDYQACNESMCLPPAAVKKAATIEVSSAR